MGVDRIYAFVTSFTHEHLEALYKDFYDGAYPSIVMNIFTPPDPYDDVAHREILHNYLAYYIRGEGSQDGSGRCEILGSLITTEADAPNTFVSYLNGHQFFQEPLYRFVGIYNAEKTLAAIAQATQ